MLCPECRGPMEEMGAVGDQDDPTQTTDWGCKNHRCLGSVFHRDSVCPQCGQRPRQLADNGTGQLVFTCKQGHEYPRPLSA